MKSVELLEAVGGIDGEYVASSEQSAKKKKTGGSIGWIAAAACLCLVIGFGVPRLTSAFQGKGGAGTGTQSPGLPKEKGISVSVNGAYYGITEDPGELERYGLPAEISGSLAGRHISYLQLGSDGYRESAAETDAELYEYAPAPGRGAYIVRIGDKCYAALLYCVVPISENASAEMDTLYLFYSVDSAGDIASVAEVDRTCSTVIGEAVTDRDELETFFRLSCAAACYGEDMDGAMTEEQREKMYASLQENLRMLRIETKSGLRFYLAVYPGNGWFYGNGTQSWYRIDGQLADWLERNLK